ncbi:MAG: hypothetical protein HC904_00105 [Blastochloris sp.]|nr:hypothetical protein [Blastochloris sp.]
MISSKTQSRQKTSETPKSYLTVLGRFLDQSWDESVLNKYYRVTRALYTTQLWIPKIRAESAPKAFGASSTVEPRMWMVHYKGQVSAPEDGTYRFVGIADNILAVAVNSKTVLVAYIKDSKVPCAWTTENKNGLNDAYVPVSFSAFNGDWIELKKNQPFDLDIITGERPGGAFYSFLMVEKKGQVYPKHSSGKTLLPPFQVAPQTLPKPFVAGKIWKAEQ